MPGTMDNRGNPGRNDQGEGIASRPQGWSDGQAMGEAQRGEAASRLNRHPRLVEPQPKRKHPSISSTELMRFVL